MRFESFSFGSIQIDGVTYEHDLVMWCSTPTFAAAGRRDRRE